MGESGAPRTDLRTARGARRSAPSPEPRRLVVTPVSVYFVMIAVAFRLAEGRRQEKAPPPSQRTLLRSLVSLCRPPSWVPTPGVSPNTARPCLKPVEIPCDEARATIVNLGSPDHLDWSSSIPRHRTWESVV